MLGCYVPLQPSVLAAVTASTGAGRTLGHTLHGFAVLLLLKVYFFH